MNRRQFLTTAATTATVAVAGCSNATPRKRLDIVEGSEWVAGLDMAVADEYDVTVTFTDAGQQALPGTVAVRVPEDDYDGAFPVDQNGEVLGRDDVASVREAVVGIDINWLSMVPDQLEIEIDAGESGVETVLADLEDAEADS